MENVEYDIVKLLGTGAFGRVFRAIDKESKKDFVIKEIDFKEEKPNEVGILEGLNHKSIVKLDKFQRKGDKLLIFQEFCYFGHAGEYLKKRKKILEEDELWSIFYSLLSGLEYCHSQNVLHLDLKVDNIFVDSKERFKLGDFGLSVRLKEGQSTLENKEQGSLRYQAPEIFNESLIDSKVDIWALGCVFYFLAAGELPFQGQDPENQKKIVNELIPEEIPR